MRIITYIAGDLSTRSLQIERLHDLDIMDHQSVWDVENDRLGLNAMDWYYLKLAEGDLSKIKKIVARAKQVNHKYYNFIKSGDLFI